MTTRSAISSRGAAALAALLIAAPLSASAAQDPVPVPVDIGYPPAESPFRDLPWRQEATVFAGWYAASTDPAGVAPQSGPMAGLRYEIRVAGPARFFARLSGVSTERTVLNPAALPELRDQGTESLVLAIADLGISLDLTGQKTWHNLVPVLAAGLGVATDFKGEDIGGYKFGTPFALSLGAGVRYAPGGRFQLRVDVTDHLYQIRYPASYFQSSSVTVDPVLDPGSQENVWKHNAALTIGVSYLFGR